MSRFSTIRAYGSHPKVVHPQELIMASFRRRLMGEINASYYAPLTITVLRRSEEYKDQLRTDLQK